MERFEAFVNLVFLLKSIFEGKSEFNLILIWSLCMKITFLRVYPFPVVLDIVHRKLCGNSVNPGLVGISCCHF